MNNWKKEKPVADGAYWLKGHIWMHPEQVELVRIAWYDGELCSVACDNVEDVRGYLPNWRDDFYWCGPFNAPEGDE